MSIDVLISICIEIYKYRSIDFNKSIQTPLTLNKYEHTIHLQALALLDLLWIALK